MRDVTSRYRWKFRWKFLLISLISSKIALIIPHETSLDIYKINNVESNSSFYYKIIHINHISLRSFLEIKYKQHTFSCQLFCTKCIVIVTLFCTKCIVIVKLFCTKCIVIVTSNLVYIRATFLRLQDSSPWDSSPQGQFAVKKEKKRKKNSNRT